MSAIITDQLRIVNARNFVSIASSTSSSYYAFVGLSNPDDYQEDWDSNPPSPKDSFDEENDYWDTMFSLKKISPSDIRSVVRKVMWESGTTYDMYRHDISRDNLSLPSRTTSLYSANYYVVNSEYKVYICIHNGTDPENLSGKPSLDEPNFTDLEPRSAGDSEDGYLWKYLYTIKPADIIKFESTNFIPVPTNWETNSEYVDIKNNAVTSGQLKVAVIKNRGVGLGTANRSYTNVPIYGDGSGAKATVTINNNSKLENVTITNGGSNYTYATLDLRSAGIPLGSTPAVVDVIIPPKNGHGYDIYRELGAYNVAVYARMENSVDNPDFIVGNKISRVGIIKDPLSYDTDSILNIDKASACYALKLVGIGYSQTTFTPNSLITQTIGTGITAVGRVVSYDKETGVLKYWQDRSLVGFNTDKTKKTNPDYGFVLRQFTPEISSGGSLNIIGGSTVLGIDTVFTGITTIINNKTYYLGQSFFNGVSTPEVSKYSGDIIYVDNRPSITRSKNQKEDIKVILQF